MKQFTVVCRGSGQGAFGTTEEHLKKIVQKCGDKEIKYDSKDFNGNVHVRLHTTLQEFFNIFARTKEEK